MANTPMEMFVKGIVAGWLIAALVWMLPSAEGTEFFVITLITYIIALGDFTHIIAGSVEAIYMWLVGHQAFLDMVGRFFLPTLIGNVAGGTLLFAVVSYAQVRSELDV
jgi:formate/nitrite transporter FocA (FNT family)